MRCRQVLRALAPAGRASVRQVLRTLAPVGRASVRQVLRTLAPTRRASLRQVLRTVAPAGRASVRHVLRTLAPVGRASVRQVLRTLAPAGRASVRTVLRTVAPAGRASLRQVLRTVAPAHRASVRQVLSTPAPARRGSCRHALSAHLAPAGRASVRTVLRALAPPRRPAAALLAACVLLGAGAAPQAQAADPDKLFGTTSQTTDRLQLRLGTGDRIAEDRIAMAQPFTTGSHGGGYRVVDAMINIRAATNRANLDLRVSIRKRFNDNQPTDAILYELTLVDSDEGVVDPNQLNRFQAPEAAWLQPDTQYWLVFECVVFPCAEGDDEAHVDLLTIPSVLDTDGLSGWSLPGAIHTKDPDVPRWMDYTNGYALSMTLNGFTHDGPYIVTDGVEVTSAGLGIDGGDHYAIGDTIEFTVTFDKNVAVTSGTTPGFRFNMGHEMAPVERTATYAGGSGSKKLRFEYTFTALDPYVDGATSISGAIGIFVGDHSETWTGAAGNITNTAGTKNASLQHPRRASRRGTGSHPWSGPPSPACRSSPRRWVPMPTGWARRSRSPWTSANP